MLMRFDPFRDIDRAFQQLQQASQSASRSFPMDAYRRGDEFVVHFDLPGVNSEHIDLTVDNNVVTMRAERRPPSDGVEEVLVAERPQGTFMRQLFLGEMLDASRIEADYSDGVLTLAIPVAERAKPRRVQVTGSGGSASIDTDSSPT